MMWRYGCCSTQSPFFFPPVHFSASRLCVRPRASSRVRITLWSWLQSWRLTLTAPLLFSPASSASLLEAPLYWNSSLLSKTPLTASRFTLTSAVAAAATTTTTFTTALHTPVARYSCGTRVNRGGGVLRRPRGDHLQEGKTEEEVTLGGMELEKEEVPKRPRRGRPPAAASSRSGGGSSGRKSVRKAASTAVKQPGTARTGQRGRPRGSVSATTAARAAATAAGAPHITADMKSQSSQEEHPSARTGKATSDNESSNDGDEAQDAELYSGQYELSPEALYAQTSARLDYPLHSVRYVITQVKDGATVPFLARYRQGETGRLDETQLRQVLDTAKEVMEVHRRRQFMLRSLESRGLLTPHLQAALEAMAHVSQLEDAWEPYKERRTSLATRGRAEGLDRYASALLHFNLEEEECRQLLTNLRAAVNRVDDGERLLTAIVAEDIQRSETVRRRLGEYCRRTTRLACTMVNKPRKKVAKDMQEENFEYLKKHFAFYDGKSWPVDRIAAHIVLALQRGESKGVLQVETAFGPKCHGLFMHTVREEFPDVAQLLLLTPPPPPSPLLPFNEDDSSCQRVGEGATAVHTTGAAVSGTLRDAGYCRHILLSGMRSAYDYLTKQLSTAVRRDLRKSAEQEAIAVFAHNLHHMLLQRPLSHSRILAMDPGHTHGVKCVVLDEHGGVETFFTCTLMDEAKMRQYVTQVVEARKLNKIVIGNGTASGETAELVADLIKKRSWKDVEFAVVSEAGASVYSVSDIAKEEFPTLDVMYRGAVSIGRRVLDPLSELVKIPVRSMGIGMYQHDVNEKELMKELGYVLESCVAKVGINAVSANRYVMEKVPGIQKKIVDQIVLARHTKKLHSREDLRRVPAMTESVYEQIAGFFRFPNSPEPLDNTNIHPESYPLVRRLVQLFTAGELTAAAGAPGAPDHRHSSTGSGGKAASRAAIGDAQTRQDVARALQALSPVQFATLASQQLSCTVETLELVTQELLHPGLDPRASLPHAGLLRREVRDVRDLRQGDVLSGVVQSVTMFGAFVDCGLHDSVLVRGDGVDTLQVGAYLKKRIRFETLDHLKRPRMLLLPDPSNTRDASAAAAAAAAPSRNGRSRRLRLESEDVLGSDGRHSSRSDVGVAELGDAVEFTTAGACASSSSSSPSLPSLSATILRERRRREAAAVAAATGDGAEAKRMKTDTAIAAPFVALKTSVEAQERAPLEKPPPLPTADARQRGQKRGRSPSPEMPHTPLHRNAQHELHSLLHASRHASVAPLMAATEAQPTGVAETSAKAHNTLAPAFKAAKPATRHGGEIDVDAQNVGCRSSSCSSDAVFSF